MSLHGYRPSSIESTAVPGTVASRRVGGHHVVWALLLAATIPWRTDVYFDGGLDSVVIAKAAVSVLALLVALHLAGRGRVSPGGLAQVPASPVIMLAAYLVVTVIGGLAHGDFVAATIVAARVAILTMTICLLVGRYRPVAVAGSLVSVLGVIVILATVTGLPSMAATGRLGGGLPPLNPNELGLMASVCFLWLFARVLRAEEATLHIVLAGGAALVVLLTGSRTSLAALCVAVVIMPLRATAMSARGIGAMALLAPLLAYVALGTDLLGSVFLRGGARGVTTLSNRTIAWDSALTSGRDPWETWFGAGLATKKIAVPGQYWNTQLLDSSWVSAVVQGGLIGLAIVALLMVTSLARAATAPKAFSPVWIGFIVYLGSRAVLESGLFDSSTAFMVLLVAMLGCRMPDPGPRRKANPDGPEGARAVERSGGVGASTR